MLVKDMTAFNERAGNALLNIMNSSLGREMTERLLQIKLAENPGMTQEEWAEAKRGLALYLFMETLKNEPALMEEYAGHVYHALRREE